MKNIALILVISGCFIAFSCNKDKKSERFKLLTGHEWTTDSLLVNGSEPPPTDTLFNKFRGDAKFNEDYTGSFGTYTGQWRFNSEETEIIIVTTELLLPLTCDIIELTSLSLKITTVAPNQANPQGPPYNIRMTFKAK